MTDYRDFGMELTFSSSKEEFEKRIEDIERFKEFHSKHFSE
jgi:hypothetical protein